MEVGFAFESEVVLGCARGVSVCGVLVPVEECCRLEPLVVSVFVIGDDVKKLTLNGCVVCGLCSDPVFLGCAFVFGAVFL